MRQAPSPSASPIPQTSADETIRDVSELQQYLEHQRAFFSVADNVGFRVEGAMTLLEFSAVNLCTFVERLSWAIVEDK